MNLAQLRTAIDRRTGAAQDRAAANAYINEAISIISSYREWPWLDASHTITITTDESYPVGSTYSETRTVNINGLEARQIYIADGDQFDIVNDIFESYSYTIEWNSGLAELKFYPQPPEGTTVSHRFTRTEMILTNDQDTPLMPERYHSIICDQAAGLFLERISPTRSEAYLLRAKQGMKQMAEATQRKTNPGRIRIRPEFPY